MLWQIVIGHRSAWFPLLSACRLIQFDTSVICHVFMYGKGSFLSQDMLLNLQEIAFEGQNMKFTVNMSLTCILYCAPGLAAIRTVCNEAQWVDSITDVIFCSRIIFLRRCRSFTLRKLYVCLETF